MRLVVRLGVEDDVRVRIEAPDVADAPQLSAEQVRLGDGEEDQQGDGAGQLQGHDPEHGASLAPAADEGPVGPVPLRVQVFDSSVHLGLVLLWLWWCSCDSIMIMIK